MNMSNTVVPAVLALTLASTPLIADTEFGEDVPRDVVELFIGNMYGGEAKLYSDIFSGFPSFTLPAGFEVIASADMGVQQRVILRTTLADAEAIAAAVAAFTSQGWTEMPVFGANAPRTGFIGATGSLPQAVSLCSDSLGRLGVTLNSATGGKHVTLSLATPAAFGGMRRSCAEDAEMAARGPGGGMLRGGIDRIREYMPALVMPPSDLAPVAPVSFTGGGGGSSNDYETRGFLSITWDGEALLTHFAEQIVEQGWQPVAQTSSAQTAFGSWTKTIEGNALLGVLTLVETGDDSWDLKFRIVRNGGEAVNE